MKVTKIRQYCCIYLLIVLVIVPAVACGRTPNEVTEINIPHTIEEERELQKSVDNGHQPWRLNPVDVAHQSVITNADKTVKYDKCSLITQKDEEAIVQCGSAKKNFKVHLKRFFGKKSIWTATQIEIIKNE
ncbi:MAG: hypothetical protein M0Z79_05075 [Nitrospiraceae bacterium]|nr:hypothetical protein [Nitrospiraceae bacterium]